MIPSAVLPNLYKLADDNYKRRPPVLRRRHAASSATCRTARHWRTILVGGLNAGGKGYYALDVTNPLRAQGRCGSSSGVEHLLRRRRTAAMPAGHLLRLQPRPDLRQADHHQAGRGNWVVIVTSGYNNVNAPAQAGDGDGYLYVLNAAHGRDHPQDPDRRRRRRPRRAAWRRSTTTSTTSTSTTPTLRVYGGDVLGNIWRFDFNDTRRRRPRGDARGHRQGQRRATPQPITIRPELAELDGKPMVLVGTGKCLGATDVDRPADAIGLRHHRSADRLARLRRPARGRCGRWR